MLRDDGRPIDKGIRAILAGDYGRKHAAFASFANDRQRAGKLGFSENVEPLERGVVDVKYIFVAAPDGQAGGGMGQVKDYILRSPNDAAGQYSLCPLVTRDGRGALFSLLLLAGALFRILVARLRGEAGLLHVNMGDRGSLARKGILLLAARACGVPTVLHLHAAELEQFYGSAGTLTRKLIRMPFRASNCVVVLGEHFRQWVVTTLNIPAEKVHILNNGVDAPRTVQRDFHGEGVQTLLFLGNLIERKGVSDLLWALSLLPPNVAPWRAVLAGGGDIEFYRELARQIGVVDKVEFPGWADRDQAGTLLRQADALILPSYDEGLPLVILEAMGVGLPVICTPVGVIPEVLDDGKTALFVEPGDRDALAERIATLLADRALQERLSVQGKALFENEFSLRSFLLALFAIYRECCGVDYAPTLTELDAMVEAGPIGKAG